MTEEKKIYTVQVWLKSQEKPIEYKTGWFYIDEGDLNNPNPVFIKIQDNYYRKDDILKIMLVSVQEESEIENNEPNSEKLPF